MRDIQIVIEPELLKYMKEKGKNNIVVQVAQADHSEIEIAEVFVQLMNDRRADELLQKRFRKLTWKGIRTGSIGGSRV